MANIMGTGACLNRDCPGRFNQKREDICIDEFRGEYRFLSNFYRAPIVCEGEVFPTVEHAYQCAKTLDAQERAHIMKANTPGVAKKRGRNVTVRPNWDEVKVDIMTYLVCEKFTQHPHLAEKLVATGDKWLVEGNDWGDTFWGVCNSEGENKLGRILMEVRTALGSKVNRN